MNPRVFYAVFIGTLYTSVSIGCNVGEVELTVTVLNAHVRSADVAGGKSDPFARVTVGAHTHHTSTITNNDRPEWNEELHFNCANTSQPIHVTVFDKDPIKSNDLLLYSNIVDWTNPDYQGVELKLFNEDESLGDYYVTVQIDWTNSCPDTCTIGYETGSCNYWDASFGILEGICDKTGTDLSDICDCGGCACYQENECAVHYTLSMADSYGDGWNNFYWTWSTAEGTQIDSGTLVTGFSGTADLCVFYEAFSCYTFAITDGPDAEFSSEISWTIYGTDGSTELASGTALETAEICTDDLCDGDLLEVAMHDSFGDGWNGNTLEIKACDGSVLVSGITLSQGSEGTARACVPTQQDGYDVVVGGGAWQNEISWEVTDLSTNTLIAEGNAPYEDGTCQSPLPSNDDSTTCAASCVSKTCDWWDELYGYSDGVCDYYGMNIEDEMGCDCTGCACNSGGSSTDDTCSRSLTLVIYDKSDIGDGWGSGNAWIWSTEAGVELATGTLEEGKVTDTAEVCMVYDAFDCYILSIEANGIWADDVIQWELQDSDGIVIYSGGASESATVCTDDLCDGTVLTIDLHDSFGDGWNGNEMIIEGCAGTSLDSERFGHTMTISEDDGGALNKLYHVCVPDAAGGRFRVEVAGGDSQGHASWTISGASPAVPMCDPLGANCAPFCAPYDGGNCNDDGGDSGSDDCNDDNSSSDDDSCVASCIEEGKTCDYWNENFGMNEADCDYFGSDLMTVYKCNCAGCSCWSNNCENFYTLNMYSSGGGGWPNTEWSWSVGGNLLDSGSLAKGTHGTHQLCLMGNKFACYTIDVTSSSPGKSESWSIASPGGKTIAEGGVPSSNVVCDSCKAGNAVLVIDMEDLGHDGWNGNELSISDCDTGVILADGITLESSASEDTQWVCVPQGRTPGTYAVHVGGGSYANEVRFTVLDFLTDAVIASGDGSYDGGNCGVPVPGPAPTKEPSSFSSPTRSPYILKTPNPTHDEESFDDDHDVHEGKGTPAAVISVLVILSVALVAGTVIYWWKRGKYIPGWLRGEPSLPGYGNVPRWSFSPGANGEGDDSVQQVGVVTFNALQKEIAMKEQKLGEQGEGGGSNGGYMSPNYTAPSMSGDLEDEEDGDDDSSGTMGV